MGAISTIYDAIVDVIEAELTTHKRLPNPYEVEENTYLHLNKAFGVGIGSGFDTQRYVGCLVTWEQSYNIVLVRRIVTTENNTAKREVIEKDILEDFDGLRKAFYLANTLSGNAIKSTVIAHGGINLIDGENMKFLALEMNLIVEYQDDPNT